MVTEIQVSTHLTVKLQSPNAKNRYFFKKNENFKNPIIWASAEDIYLHQISISLKSVEQFPRYGCPHVVMDGTTDGQTDRRTQLK